MHLPYILRIRSLSNLQLNHLRVITCDCLMCNHNSILTKEPLPNMKQGKKEARDFSCFFVFLLFSLSSGYGLLGTCKKEKRKKSKEFFLVAKNLLNPS